MGDEMLKMIQYIQYVAVHRSVGVYILFDIMLYFFSLCTCCMTPYTGCVWLFFECLAFFVLNFWSTMKTISPSGSIKMVLTSTWLSCCLPFCWPKTASKSLIWCLSHASPFFLSSQIDVMRLARRFSRPIKLLQDRGGNGNRNLIHHISCNRGSFKQQEHNYSHCKELHDQYHYRTSLLNFKLAAS